MRNLKVCKICPYFKEQHPTRMIGCRVIDDIFLSIGSFIKSPLIKAKKYKQCCQMMEEQQGKKPGPRKNITICEKCALFREDKISGEVYCVCHDEMETTISHWYGDDTRAEFVLQEIPPTCVMMLEMTVMNQESDNKKQ